MRRGSSAPTGPWSEREMCVPAAGEGRGGRGGGGGRGEGEGEGGGEREGREGSGRSIEGMLLQV